jgi:hypothetical protein
MDTDGGEKGFPPGPLKTAELLEACWRREVFLLILRPPRKPAG